MHRWCALLVAASTLAACGGDPAGDDPPPDAAESATSTPALPGTRVIDRARDAAAAAGERALRHDTLR